jgi:2-polyprenyl-6-hydroxyphenyl methylase/3-demethylubiquinone-9 3-methyltransferase
VAQAAIVKDLQEDVWAALPADLDPPVFGLRRAFLQEHVESGQSVLDLGCGEGTFTTLLAEAGAAPVGVDIAEHALERARARHPHLDFRLVPEDGPLPFDDAGFDLVWATEVLAHVGDTARLLSELRRVLRPRGLLLITTPYHGRVQSAALALTRFEAHFDARGPQLRFYTGRSLRALLYDFGFEQVRVRGAGGLPLVRSTLLASARRATVAPAG